MKYAIKSRRLALAITTLLFITIILGLFIVPIEQQNPSANIKGVGDGIWWAFTTVTAVGYGDLFPTTTLGRVLGVILQLAGVTNFGLIIALFTINLFRHEQQFYWSRQTERFDRLEEKLTKLEQKQDYSIKENHHSDSKT